MHLAVAAGDGDRRLVLEFFERGAYYGLMSVLSAYLALAVSQDCSWVGRGFAGRVEHLTGLYKQALTHQGFALLEVLQPCVTFNHVNTYQWYQARVYEVEQESGYDPENELWAYRKAREWGERIPIGVIFKRSRPLLEETHPVLKAGPLLRQQSERPIRELLSDFF